MRITGWIRIPGWLGVAAFMLSGAASGWAQSGQRPMGVLIVQVEVKASQTAEYEAALKELHKTFAEHNFPFASIAFRNENDYLYVVPIKVAGLIDLSPLEEAMMALRQSIGREKFLELTSRVQKHTVSKSSMIVSGDPRMSHYPADPIFKYDPKGNI